MPRTDWPPYQTVRALINRHPGRAAVVMGGGPSLGEGVLRCPEDALYFDVNAHGHRWVQQHDAGARKVAYTVACDKIEERVKPIGVPIVSRHMWADYRLLFMPAPSSAVAAAFVARLMGCAPIIVCGIDLYQTGTYHDDPHAWSNGQQFSMHQHAQYWRKLAGQWPAQYRVASGHPLLLETLAAYDPAEAPAEPTWPERAAADVNGVWVRLVQSCMVATRSFERGRVLELRSGEAERLLFTKQAVAATPGEVESCPKKSKV